MVRGFERSTSPPCSLEVVSPSTDSTSVPFNSSSKSVSSSIGPQAYCQPSSGSTSGRAESMRHSDHQNQSSPAAEGNLTAARLGTAFTCVLLHHAPRVAKSEWVRCDGEKPVVGSEGVLKKDDEAGGRRWYSNTSSIITFLSGTTGSTEEVVCIEAVSVVMIDEAVSSPATEAVDGVTGEPAARSLPFARRRRRFRLRRCQWIHRTSARRKISHV
ncbi:hypothetical protein DFJ73DRAFT_348442 [Zopfochytrium polystomum]|nr:hypothetical protein DFJ73DRAFT_348442 [Zopfochytrium polystomum]